MSLDDQLNNLTLASEHLANAAAMFRGIAEMIDNPSPVGLEHAQRLARFACDQADIASGDFDTFAEELKAQGVAS